MQGEGEEEEEHEMHGGGEEEEDSSDEEREDNCDGNSSDQAKRGDHARVSEVN